MIVRCRGAWVLACWLLTTPWVFAHAVGLEVKQKGTQVTVEGFFDDDSPADDAKVVLEDANGQVVLEGKTDAKGVWTFMAPKPGQYKVKLDAGSGHRATKMLTIAEPTPTPTEAPPQTVSEGTTREEFTRTPWAKIGIGLAVILLGASVFWLRKRAKTIATQVTP